jgi:hypothetical protein
MIIANQSKSKSIFIFIIIIFLTMVGLLSVYLLKYNQTKPIPVNNNQQTNNNFQELKPIISGWKVYENKEYGFRVDYPAEWKAEIINDVANLTSPETSKKIEEQKALFNGENYGPFTYDITISYFPTILLRFNNENTDLTTLDELIKEDITMKKLGETNVNGISAIEMEFYGEDIHYGLFIEKNEHLYEIIFNNIRDKKLLTDAEKQILSTFQLIK